MVDNQQSAVIYARYSSHSQRDVSIEQQLKACRMYAEKLGLTIVHVYADHAMTGTNDKRPEFQQMINDSSKCAFAYVIVYTLDRFARDRYDSAVYKRELKTHGVRVLSAMEQISDDPTGVLMESILEGYAEYYSRELSRKIRRGMEDNAEKCMANGVLPLGYCRGKDGRYEIVESDAAIVREVYRRVAAGEQFVSIQNDLNKRGCLTKKGALWNRSSFRTLLENERYIGIYKYGDIRVEGGIPTIIEKSLFQEVQEKLTTKKNPRATPEKRRRENSVYLLTGKLFCGNCKGPMIGISGTSKTGALHFYYECRQKRQLKNCNKKAAAREAVEQSVAEALYNVVLRDDVIEWMADQAIAYQNSRKESTELATLESRLAEAAKVKSNLINAIEQGIITPTTKERLMQAEADEASLTAKIALMRDSEERHLTRDQVIAAMELVREGDVRDKGFQEFLFDTFLRAAYLYDDHIRIVANLKDDGETDVPIDFDKVDEVAEAECEVRISSSMLHQTGIIRTCSFSRTRSGFSFLGNNWGWKHRKGRLAG